MHDPADLFKRAKELAERAEAETTPELRERMLKMAALYTHLAESEQQLAASPTSIASIGDMFRT